MDVLMVLMLVVGFASLMLFANWCGKQVDDKK